MASSNVMHKRQNVSTNRPLYRDGKRGRAVKVFTINQESRYLLVHGVPDINITDELLKLLSLYGVIEEYNTIDDDSSAEEFTKTHWIKYADIQAARVARRKLDDYSFYGGFLHVTYAPEYETIQDTREKLQQRRMDVARRLRKLAQERAPHVDDGIETVHVSSSTEGTNNTLLDRPSPVTAWTSTPPLQPIHVQSTSFGLPLVTAGDDIDHDTGQYVNEHGTPDIGVPQIPPSLPEPPRRLPPWQWNIPRKPEFPRLRTSHDTLPSGFSPFPERGSHLNQDRTGNHHQTPSSIPALPSQSFIGPLHPPKGDSVDSTSSSDTACSSQHRQRYSESGARPKLRLSSSMNTSQNDGTLEKRTDCEQNGKAVDGESIQTDQCPGFGSQAGHPQADLDASEREQRPKLVGRRRLGPNPSGSSDKQVDMRNSSAQHTSSFASQHAFLPRPVSTRVKRSASSIDEDDQQTESGHQSSPAADDTSFDRTVSSVRQQMLQVSQAGACGTAPRSVIQAAIIQARNQERMGLLPHRPPTKRQRI